MHTVGYFYIRNLFFVQALRLHPELDGYPFWIERRGKVLAHSPCLERDGLHPGLSARRARRIAPQAHRLEYRPEDYRGTHDLFCHIAHRFTPVVEPLNPGEIFLGLQGADMQTAQALVAEARDLGFEATVAIAGSRLTARLAGRIHGPGCILVVPGEETAFLANRSIECLWSVPRKTRERLGRMGINRVADLQRISRQTLITRFGPQEGLLLFEAARGRDLHPLRAAWPPETLEAEARLEGLADRLALERHLRALAKRLSAQLAEGGKRCGRLRLELREEGSYLPLTEAMVLGPPASGENRLALAALRLAGRMSVRRPLEGARLVAEDLSAAPVRQLDLSAPVRAMENGKKEFQAYLTLRFGSGTLRFCSELAGSWRERMLGFLAVEGGRVESRESRVES
jgi:DNA polymerase-4